MTQQGTDKPRQWLEAFILKRAGIASTEFIAIADSPIYELLDSLDLVEMLGAVEQHFGVTIDAASLPWERQPSAEEFVSALAIHLPR